MIFLFLQCASTVIIVYIIIYKSTELVSLYTLDIGLIINIIIKGERCGSHIQPISQLR